MSVSVELWNKDINFGIEWRNPIDQDVLRVLGEIGCTDADSDIVASTLKPVYEPFIEEYIHNSLGRHGYRLEHVETFEIDRPIDKVLYRTDLSDKRLLWHGTKQENIYPILKDGFKLQLAKEFGMFGPGIYFSDCVSKSFNYSTVIHKSYEQESFPTGFIFLCEVGLGKIMPFTKAEYKAKNRINNGNTANSAWGIGYNQSKTAKYWNNEVMICPGPLNATKRHTLEYNEYVVYCSSQISLRYLVKVRRLCYENPLYRPLSTPQITRGSKYLYYLIEVKSYAPVELVEHVDKKMSRSTSTTRSSLLTLPPTAVKKPTRRRKANPVSVNQPTAPATNQITPIPTTNTSLQINNQLDFLLKSMLTNIQNSLPTTSSTMGPPTASLPTNNYQLFPAPPIVSYQNLLNNVQNMQQQFPSQNSVNSTPMYYNPALNVQPPVIQAQSTTIGNAQNPISFDGSSNAQSTIAPANNPGIQQYNYNPVINSIAPPNSILYNLTPGPTIANTRNIPVQQQTVGTQQNPIVLDDETLPDIVPQPAILSLTDTNTQPSTTIIGTVEKPIQIDDDELIVTKVIPTIISPSSIGTQLNPIQIDEDHNPTSIPVSANSHSSSGLQNAPTTTSFSNNVPSSHDPTSSECACTQCFQSTLMKLYSNS